MKKQLLVLVLCAGVCSMQAAATEVAHAKQRASELLSAQLTQQLKCCVQTGEVLDLVAQKKQFESALELLVVMIDNTLPTAARLGHGFFRRHLLFKLLALYFLGKQDSLKVIKKRFAHCKSLKGEDEYRYKSYRDIYRLAKTLVGLSELSPEAQDQSLFHVPIDVSGCKHSLGLVLFYESLCKKGLALASPPARFVKTFMYQLWSVFAQVRGFHESCRSLADSLPDILPRALSTETLRAISPARTGGSSVDLLPGGTKDEEVSSPKRQRRREPVVAPSVLDDMPRDLSALDVPADLDDLFAGF